MQRRSIFAIGIIATLLIGGLVWFVSSSNVLRSVGTVRFAPGENGMNSLEIIGPPGWHCIQYEKTLTIPNDPNLHPGGKGMFDCKLFGGITTVSNAFPAVEMTRDVRLNEPTLVYQNPDKTYEIYVWITKDADNFDNLERIVDPQ